MLTLFDFTILDSACLPPTVGGSESECQRQGERKLWSFERLNVRSREVCTHRVVVLKGLRTTYRKLAFHRYQR